MHTGLSCTLHILGGLHEFLVTGNGAEAINSEIKTSIGIYSIYLISNTNRKPAWTIGQKHRS